MVYSRSSIQHVHVNWGLDSGEVSRSIGQLFHILFKQSNGNSEVYIIQSNFRQFNVTELSIFTICACVYVCVHVGVNQ